MMGLKFENTAKTTTKKKIQQQAKIEQANTNENKQGALS